MKQALLSTVWLASTVLTDASLTDRQTQADPNLDVSKALQNILSNTHGSDLYTYPTDFTRGIIPKKIHSHNDYWRDVPFYSALSVGAISVEADVWLYNDTLHVGHEESALTDARTFDSLYIQPILSVLKRQNPTSKFVSGQTHNGVFDTTSDQTLYLFVDLKTDGETTMPAVVKALQPLREGGWLTKYNGSAVTRGAVTVIGTGNTPLDQVAGVNDRDYFFDANLALLNSSQSNITKEISPIASTQFSRYIGSATTNGLNDTQISLLKSQIDLASSKGIGARYWDTPAWPDSTRNNVWIELVNAGVALLNADDLDAAAGLTVEW